jgi:hypothetical protein
MSCFAEQSASCVLFSRQDPHLSVVIFPSAECGLFVGSLIPIQSIAEPEFALLLVVLLQRQEKSLEV